jgi:hypothetical protein
MTEQEFRARRLRNIEVQPQDGSMVEFGRYPIEEGTGADP